MLYPITGILRLARGFATEKVYPFPGDLLRYQRDGAPIRSYILQQIYKTGAKVILAHSLGGIACVDLLASQPVSEVELLVTVGSQAPFLYELDALWSLRSGQALPAHFPRWINLYDRNDMLSYTASGVFGARVQDLEVRSGQAFPIAHGASWLNHDTWAHIAAALRVLA